MKKVFSYLLGLTLLFTITSCAGWGTSPGALEQTAASGSGATATPTSLPPTPSHVSPASLPEVCDCVLRFDRISIQQGLSQSSVHVAFQDSRGFMWFGTQDGLNRYDGYTFKTFKPDPDVTTSLSDRWITSLSRTGMGICGLPPARAV